MPHKSCIIPNLYSVAFVTHLSTEELREVVYLNGGSKLLGFLAIAVLLLYRSSNVDRKSVRPAGNNHQQMVMYGLHNNVLCMK